MTKSTISIIVLMVMCVQLTAQVIITTNDLPMANQNYNQLQATPIEIADPSFSAGIDMEWDFSGLQELNTQNLSYIPVSQTPFLYQFLFTQATFASAGDDLDIAGIISLTDVYNYYRNVADGYYDLGFGSMFNGFPLLGQRNPTDRILQLPLEFGNSPDENDSYYQLSVPGIALIRNWQTRLNIIDGWGTVTTPLGSFEALRVRSVLSIEDSVEIDFQGIVIDQGFTRPETIEYRWLSPGMGIPVLQINTTDGQVTQVFYRGENSTVGVQEFVSEKLNIFPNPAQDLAQFFIPENDLVLNLRLVDASGRWITNEFEQQGNSLIINTSSLNAGIYQLIVETKKGILGGKLVVQ
jgi:hypothetical protein